MQANSVHCSHRNNVYLCAYFANKWSHRWSTSQSNIRRPRNGIVCTQLNSSNTKEKIPRKQLLNNAIGTCKLIFCQRNEISYFPTAFLCLCFFFSYEWIGLIFFSHLKYSWNLVFIFCISRNHNIPRNRKWNLGWHLLCWCNSEMLCSNSVLSIFLSSLI